MPGISPQKKFIFPFSPADNRLGQSSICTYLYEYLEAIGAKTCLHESDYIDKDYLIDYSKFYSRSFEKFDKTTDRHHFFTSSFGQIKFKRALENEDKDFFKALQESYLGFIVLKPIKNILGQRLIGKTVLATYPEHHEIDIRCFLTNEHKVSLYGIPLKVKTLPFQQKDNAVGVCATVTCWSAQFPLMHMFGTPILSPVEVTERAVMCPSEDSRNFPSDDGLTLSQLKYYFNSMNLETEFINPKPTVDSPQTPCDDIIADAVRAYIELGLPIIATLNLKGTDDYHAVLITGYRHTHGKVREIYVHDDNIGPYHRIKPNRRGKFTSWKESGSNGVEKEYELQRLLIPVYPKIRLSFGKVYRAFLQFKRGTEIFVSSGTYPPDTQTELFLTDIHRYRQFLLTKKFEEKKDIVREPAARFLWVIRIHNGGIPIRDYVLDGTAIYPNKIIWDIEFQQ
ncbi:MAG: hypothetical protein WC015_07975 [Methanoregula sp.]